MGERSKHNSDLLAFALTGIGLTAAAIYLGDNDRKHNRKEEEKPVNSSGRRTKVSSDDGYLHPTRPKERRPRSWNGHTNHYAYPEANDSTATNRKERVKELEIEISSDKFHHGRGTSPGVEVYRERPREITISIIGDNESIPEEQPEDESFNPPYAGEQLREYEFLGDYDLFRSGMANLDDQTPSRPSTPVQEPRQESVQYLDYPKYQYTPLPSSGERIRLIQLHPGEPSEALRCSFFEQEFFTLAHGQGGYVAISYSWQVGKEKVKPSYNYPLLCDNSPNFLKAGSRPRGPWVLPLVKSADTVLRRFRKSSNIVVLWIDAICLNQEDSSEKHYQLRHMKDIYSKADEVRVWLDESAMNIEYQSRDDKETLGEKCIKFFRGYGKWRMNQPTSPSLTAVRTKLVQHLMESFDISNLSEVASFFQNIKWFSRRWIIQEITHAHNAIIFCGRESVSWDEFAASIQSLWRAERSQFKGRPRIALEVLHTIRGLKDPDPRNRYVCDILQALNFFHASDCRDAQDRILALLPISRDRKDYEEFHYGLRSTPEKTVIYHKFAHFNLTKSGCLDILHCASAFRPKSNSLPHDYEPMIASWVPDWTCNPRFSSFLKAEKFNAGAPGRYDIDIRSGSGYYGNGSYAESTQGLSLVLKGFIADDIQHIQSRDLVATPALEDFRKVLDNWSYLAGCWSLDLITSVPSREQNTLAITLIADQGISKSSLQPGEYLEKRIEEEDVKQEINAWQGFCNLFRITDNPGILAVGNDQKAKQDARDERWRKDEQIRQTYLEKLKETMRGRRLFKTCNGQLGIGPDDIKSGDRIAILYGGRTPFIVRSVKEGVQNPQKYFCELIGDCYVHGMMNGQLMDEPHSTREFWII